jgi:hypothetical protein
MLSTTMKKKSLKAVATEFRRCMAHHRAQGASEERIRQILGEAIHLAFREVKDPEERAWLCEQFDKAVRVTAIVSSHPSSGMLH